MSDILTFAITAYDNYRGSGGLVLLAFVGLLYLWIMEDKPYIKRTLIYIPLLVLVLFFCPVFSYPVSRYLLDGGVYYRILWLVPFTIITAYCFVRVIAHMDTQKKRVILIAAFSGMVMVSGSFIYLNPLMSIAENPYHISDRAIEVADIMRVNGRTVKAVIPGELLQSIRQYDPSINLAYGREALVDGWSANPLYELMETNPVKSFHLTDEAKSQGVEYIVLRTKTGIVGSKPIEQYEFTLLAQVEDYDIYIFDRADFAGEKKDYYLPLLDPDRESFYIDSPTGDETPYR